MNEHLRQRILRRIEALPDDRGYQILDYVEFLETKYAERAAPAANAFTKFTDAVEDRLRVGRVSATAIAETVGLMNRAATVLSGAMEATKSIANELTAVPAALWPATPPPTPRDPATIAPAAAAQPKPPDTSPTGRGTSLPGTGEEKR